MSIFFLVVALLVAVILLSRLTWWPAWGERRSVKHHEHAMDVLRSFASRRIGSEDGGIGAGERPSISPADDIGPAAVSDEIPPPAPAGAGQEMVSLLKEEPPPGELPAPPASLPPASAPPATASAASPVAPVGPDPVEDLASAGTGDAGAGPGAGGKATVERSFVFFAEDGGDDLLAPSSALPSPPSLEDVTGPPASRSRALLLSILQMDRSRLGLAFGLVTVVVMATVLGTLVAFMSNSSNSQRVRQVAGPPTTVAPAPAPSPPTTSSPVTTEVPPPTTVLPAQSSTTTPTTSIPRPVRTLITSPPPTTTPPTTAITSPPTTSTPASVVSSTPPTTSPPPPTTTTTRPTTTTTSPTTTTTNP